MAHLDQTENEFRNIKLKLKGPHRHSELQAIKALMAMSAQQNLVACENDNHHRHNQGNNLVSHNHLHHLHQYSTNNATKVYQATNDGNPNVNSINNHQNHHLNTPNNSNHKSFDHSSASPSSTNGSDGTPMDLRSRLDSPEPVYGLQITMTEDEFRELAEREGIKDVIGKPVCKLCGGLFSGPLGIALHMCPAMKRQTYRCEICGEDKWKTKANLHSHIKWCKKREP